MKRTVIVLVALLLQAAAFAQGKTPQPPKDKDPWAGRADLLVPPKITPTTEVSLGAVERFTLPNGLQVIVVPRREVPAVSVSLAVRAGSTSDPIDRAGVAQFTASMLRKGTQKRSSDQIANAIDFVGGSLDAGADDDGTLVYCRARSKDLGLCLDLVADVTQRPTFPEAELGEIRDQLNASVEGAKDSPQQLAAQHAANLYFGDDDQRGRPMSKRSLSLIDRAALVAFHKAWYAPNNTVMAISGDVNPKALKALVSKYFGGWKKAEIAAQPARGLPAKPGLQVRLVDKPDATQSAIVIVGPGIKHSDPDYFAVRIMNFALGGGGFSSRLMKVVRSEGGKTYGARSSFDARREPGPWVASTFTRTSETVSTIKLVLGELERMRKSGPTAEELDAAKGNMIGGYGLKLETGGDVARLLLNVELDGLDPKFPEEYPARLKAVTLADAARVANRLLTPQALVIVGKADEVRPALAKAKLDADGKIEVVKYTDPVSAAERKAETEERAQAGAMTPEEAKAGQKLLAEALKAKGGDALMKVKDLTMSGKGTMTMQGQTLPIAIQEFLLPGKAARQELALGPGKVIQVYADGNAFMREGARVVDLPPQAAISMRRGLWRDPNFILLHATQPGAKVRGLPPVTEGATTLEAMVVISPAGDQTTVYLDPKTKHIVKLVYTDDGKETRDELADYRAAGGILFPHKLTHVGANEKVDVSYEKIEVNKGLGAELFKR